ncbi:MAG: hypothetical protein LUC24_00295 [Bacteroidales bacterium]|nr:hypothetical protein [Bacteroidales bacterium]
MFFVKDIDSYLNKVLGLKFESEEELQKGLGPVPAAVGNCFECELCAIEGEEYALLVQKNPADRLSLLIRNVRLAEKSLGLECVLVTDMMDNTLRRQFISHRISFVVPLRQIYIPQLGTYFTENKLNAYKEVDSLTPAAQFLLLYHLEKRPFDDTNLSSIAGELGYTPKTVTVVAGELKRAGLCEIAASSSKTKKLIFTCSGRELWDKAWPMLSSPIQQVGYVPEDAIGRSVRLPSSGENAIARFSHRLEMGKKPGLVFARKCCAVRKRTPQGFKLHEAATITNFPGAVRIEFWRYDPNKLAYRGYVDPLSLALCYKGDPSRSVHTQLMRIIDDFFSKNTQWY